MVELIIVLAVVGILAAYAAMQNGSPAMYTLLSQAQTMASDLRHVQTLATTWGKSLRVTIVGGPNGSYSISCVTDVAFPCDSNPVINPLTGVPFTVNLSLNVALSGPATLDINSLGKPSAGATYVVSGGGASKNVTVAPITGYVEVP